MIWFLALLGVFTLGCAPEKPEIKNRDRDESTAVVEVNGEAITLKEFERRIAEFSPEATAKFKTVEQKRAYLEYIAQFEALADYAESQGFSDDPRVVAAVQRSIVDRAEQKIPIDSSELEARIEAAMTQRTTPAKRRVSLFTHSEKERCDELEQNLAEVEPLTEKFERFSNFAKSHSSDPSRSDGGNLGLIVNDQTPIAAAAFTTEIGQTKTLQGAPCTIVFVTGGVPVGLPDRSKIGMEIRTEMVREAIKRARSGATN